MAVLVVVAGALAGCMRDDSGRDPGAVDAMTVPMAWSNITLPPERGWFSVLLDLSTWCQADAREIVIEWRVDGEGATTGSPWGLTSFTFVDTINGSASALGGAVTYQGMFRWFRVGASAGGQPVGTGVENPLAPDLEAAGVDDFATVRTGGPCLRAGADKVERMTGQRPDAFLFTFARDSQAHVRWNITLHVPTEGVMIGSGPEDDHVVYYEDQMPRMAGAYAAGTAVSYDTVLETELGVSDAVTTLAFMPGNEVGAGHGMSVERTNASMTLPGKDTMWVMEQDWAVLGSSYGPGDWTFTIEAKGRTQYNDAVVFGATVPLGTLRAFAA